MIVSSRGAWCATIFKRHGGGGRYKSSGNALFQVNGWRQDGFNYARQHMAATFNTKSASFCVCEWPETSKQRGCGEYRILLCIIVSNIEPVNEVMESPRVVWLRLLRISRENSAISLPLFSFIWVRVKIYRRASWTTMLIQIEWVHFGIRLCHKISDFVLYIFVYSNDL